MKSWSDIPFEKILGYNINSVRDCEFETTIELSNGSYIHIITDIDCISILRNGVIQNLNFDNLIGLTITGYKISEENALILSLNDGSFLEFRLDNLYFESYLFEIFGHTYAC